MLIEVAVLVSVVVGAVEAVGEHNRKECS